MGSSLRFLGHPCGACPGLETPASLRDLALTVAADIAFRWRNHVGLATLQDFGAESSRPATLLSTLRTLRSPEEWQDSLLTCLLDFDQAGFAPAG
jgi:hypothetical protein